MVDKELRNKLIDATSRYMRKEVDYIEFAELVHTLRKSDSSDNTAQKLAHKIIILGQYYGRDMETHDAMMRILAFLASDLQEKIDVDVHLGIGINQLPGAIAIFLIATAIYLQSWIGAAGSYRFYPVYFLVILSLQKFLKESEEETEFYPFLNEVQMREHVALCRYNIPPFEARYIKESSLSKVIIEIEHRILSALLASLAAVPLFFSFSKETTKRTVF